MPCSIRANNSQAFIEPCAFVPCRLQSPQCTLSDPGYLIFDPQKNIDLKLRLVCVYFEEFAFCDIHPLNRKSVQPHMDPECIILILASMYVCECVRRACIHLGNCLWEKS